MGLYRALNEMEGLYRSLAGLSLLRLTFQRLCIVFQLLASIFHTMEFVARSILHRERLCDVNRSRVSSDLAWTQEVELLGDVTL